MGLAAGESFEAELELGEHLLPQLPSVVVSEVIEPAVEAVAHQVAREAVDRLEEHDPVRRQAVQRHVEVAIRRSMRQFVELCETGAQHIDVAPVRDLGRLHALAGYSLEQLTTLHQVGSRGMWRRAVELCIDQDLDTEVLLPIGEAIFAFTDAMSRAASEGFDAGAAELSISRDARHLELLRLLLDRSSDLLDDATRAAIGRLGWTVPARVAVALATVGRRRRSASRIPEDVVHGTAGDRVVVVVPEPEGRDLAWLEDEYGSEGLVALGPSVPFSELLASHDQAEQLLAMAHAERRSSGLVRVDNHAVDMMLEQQPELAEHLVVRRLGPLVDLPQRRREPLLETLDAWLRRPGQLSAIADDLHVHPQTVRYRVERLRELLGAQLDDPDRRMQLALAVRAVERDITLGAD